MGNPTYFTDDASVASREAETPNASFQNGMNKSGSNACGLGINLDEGAVVGTPEQFTLNDQFGNPRLAQISQHIGGSGFTAPGLYPSSGGNPGTLPDSIIYSGANSANGDGNATRAGDAHLVDLATGWTTV